MRNREAMGHLAYMAMEVAVPQPGGGAKNCVHKKKLVFSGTSSCVCRAQWNEGSWHTLAHYTAKV